MDEIRVLTRFCRESDQYRIDTYEKNGGYQAIRKALSTLPRDQLVEMVKQSGLRGRGGAGYYTGVKWGFIPNCQDEPRYVVCNADESEPGTFKDRLLIENDPHQILEGLMLASYAIGAEFSVIYCRGEYYKGNDRLQIAVEEAKSKGYLGKNIFNSAVNLEIVVHPGAGAYIAGEETALLNSLEGYRATPRLKPPYPAIAGLYQKPTVVNNVETLCNVVHIVNCGVDWYHSLGKPSNHGTKIYQISGHVNHPGCFEFPLGVTLEEVIAAAGGILDGRPFKACYPGGSSCALLTAKDLSISLDFDTLLERQTALGTASLIVMDDTTDMVKVAHRLMEFYQNESCGKCTPCREGTRWVVQILDRILKGKGLYQDLDQIENICHNMAETSFCALAVGAAPPVISAIKEFRSEFIQAIQKNEQASNPPTMRLAYPYLKSVGG